MCRLLGVSSSGFVGWKKRGAEEVSARKQLARIHVNEVFEKKKRRYGSLRIWRELRNKGIKLSKSTVESAMRDLGLKAKGRRRYVSTTNSKHGRPVCPNLLDRKFTCDKVDSVWLSGILEFQSEFDIIQPL
jgi:transposase InsO family protein